MKRSDLPKVAQFCIDKVNAAADPDGFVPLHKLVPAFRAELQARPLLVEAMIAAPKRGLTDDARGPLHWKVLVDEETHFYTPEAYREECAARPLSARLRFTVAHELAHSVGFRADELGFALAAEGSRRITRRKLVGRLEAETNMLSPLLLISETALMTEFQNHPEGLTLTQLTVAREKNGVSREVFISRLNLLELADLKQLRFKKCLNNVALGIGEWRSPKDAVLLEWPLFLKFDQNLVPEFLIKLRQQQLASLRDFFSAPEFRLNGGDQWETQANIQFGTTASPHGDTMRVSLAVERVKPAAGNRFFFLVKSL